jgi:hypothetical protein
MIEQQLEAAVVAKFAALNIDGLTVYGFWQPTSTGIPKGREAAAPAALGIVVAPRSYETFTTPKALFTVAVTLKVRRDIFPTGAELAEFTEPIFDLFQTWQMSIDQVKTDFTMTDENDAPVFVPHGFKLDGGDVSTDPDAGVWVITQTFTLRGVM